MRGWARPHDCFGYLNMLVRILERFCRRWSDFGPAFSHPIPVGIVSIRSPKDRLRFCFAPGELEGKPQALIRYAPDFCSEVDSLAFDERRYFLRSDVR
jgi:hypothetical protein